MYFNACIKKKEEEDWRDKLKVSEHTIIFIVVAIPAFAY